jgi:hypothetical protein
MAQFPVLVAGGEFFGAILLLTGRRENPSKAPGPAAIRRGLPPLSGDLAADAAQALGIAQGRGAEQAAILAAEL